MHTEAMAWVATHATDKAVKVLDIGGRDINGNPRHLYPNATFTVVDLHEGPNVDVIEDVCDWEPRDRFDVVLCLEVLEHAENWTGVLDAAHRLTKKGGTLVVTAAGTGRQPHSAYDGGVVRPGEHYENITREALTDALAKWRDVTIDISGHDIRATATK